VFVYYFRRLPLIVSSHLAAIIEPKKIAIVTSAQRGKLSITIPGICAPTRPFSSPSGLSPITPRKAGATQPQSRSSARTIGRRSASRTRAAACRSCERETCFCPFHGSLGRNART